MDLETLQRRWAALDQTIDDRLQRHAALLRGLYMQTVRAPLRRRSWAIGAEIALSALLLLLLGGFIFAHRDAPPFLIPGLALHLFAIWQLAGGVRQLVALRTLDYSAPPVTIQAQLARLRVQSLTQLLWTVALSPLLWPLLLVVGLKGLLGIDAYAALGLPWLGANLLAGVIAVPLALWLARALRHRFGAAPAFQRLLDDLAGGSLREAREALAAAAAFADEPPPAR